MYRKSQIAIEYAYRIREERPDTWVFWVYASSITRVEEGLRGIAEKTQAPGWDEANADTLGLVSHWLATHGPWVLIIDNADKMDVVCGPWRSQHNQAGHENRSLSDNLPMTANGSVLITSRSRDVAFRLTGDSGHIIQVGSMDLTQAGTLLRKTLTVSASVEDVKTLVQSLDGIPLALTQAAAFINQHHRRMTVSNYLEVVQRGDRQQTGLLLYDLADLQRDRDSSNSIITTLFVSFDHIRQVHSSAARLLAFMSCFDHEAIPIDLLNSYHKVIKIDVFKFDFDLQDDLNVLQAYSLVWVNPTTNTFRMHRLVKLSVTRWLEGHDELEEWHERCVKIMAEAFPDGGYENWKQCQILFPQAEAILKYRLEGLSLRKPWATVLFCASRYAKDQGWFDKAQGMAEASLQARERVLGEDHPDTLSSMTNLALIHLKQGRLAIAEELLVQVSKLKKQMLGEQHPDTLVSMTNLASTYQEQGRLAEAEELLIQVVKTEKQVLVKEHPDTLTSMNNLADALSNQGKYEVAEAILRRTLMLRQKVLGKEHPETLSSTIGLGEILRCRGDYIESEKMLVYALTKQVQALSAESPNIQKGIDSLISVFIHSPKTQIEFIPDHKHRDKYNGMLQIAAVRGSEELVRQLVQKRIQVDFADATHNKALETAANRGHTTVVRMLLEDGAESGSEDAIGNALQAASAGGHRAVVRLLLGKGADVNAVGGRYDNALQAASANGHEAVVRLLLEKGADVNAGGGRYDNALQAASAGGHEAVVRLLLEKGADVNAGGGRYDNALQAASAGDHQIVTRLLTDTALTSSSICDSRIVRDEDDTASFSSSTTSTMNLKLPSTTSDRSFLASSVTSLKNKLPEEVFKILTFEVLLDPDMKDLCEKMLKIKGESLFIRLFKREIRSFCSALYTENQTESTYFAFRVCQLLKPSTIRKGWQLEDLVDQTIEAGVEKYLQGLRQVDQSPRDDTAVESTSEMGAVETASQDSRSAEDHAGAGDHGIVSVGNKQADDAADDASTFVEDESSASSSLDDELDIIPLSLTKDTISWLRRGVSYRNFKHNITKQICSPLQYVHRVLQPALASELCSATFHVEWQLIQYTNSELEEGDTLVHALTVSGDIIDAEASSCLDYCRRIWPVTGEFVLITLEKAIKAGWHGKHDVICLELELTFN